MTRGFLNPPSGDTNETTRLRASEDPGLVGCIDRCNRRVRPGCDPLTEADANPGQPSKSFVPFRLRLLLRDLFHFCFCSLEVPPSAHDIEHPSCQGFANRAVFAVTHAK